MANKNIVEKSIKDFCTWARVRPIDLANAAGLTRQALHWHSKESSSATVVYNKKTNEFVVQNGDDIYATGKIKHIEVNE